MARVRMGHGMAGQNYCVVGGCLLSLSLCRRGFQDLLKVRPSFLFILCGCISSSIASLMSRSMYPVLAERSFVSCNDIVGEQRFSISDSLAQVLSKADGLASA